LLSNHLANTGKRDVTQKVRPPRKPRQPKARRGFFRDVTQPPPCKLRIGCYICRKLNKDSKCDLEVVTAPVPPVAPSPFTDFDGLVRHLPAYGQRTIRTLVKRGLIPCVRLPGTRKLNFHIPSVEAALLRYQEGGPANLPTLDMK